MTHVGDKEAWSRHFEQLALGHGGTNDHGIYVLKAKAPAQPQENQQVTVIDPVQSQVDQAVQELKEEQTEYRERVKGVKYNIPPDTRKPPSKRNKSVIITPPTDALEHI